MNIIHDINKKKEYVETYIHEHPTLFIRIFYGLVLLFLYIVLAIFSICVLIFLPTHQCFQTIHVLVPTKGYAVSYTGHRKKQRIVRISAVSSLIVAILITIINGIFTVPRSVIGTSYTVTCSGSSETPTDITESTYTINDALTLDGAGYCQLDEALTIGTFTIQNGVTLTHLASNKTGITVTATTMDIQTGAQINVDGKGCIGGTSSGNGYGP
ncbi:MAG TPA: hypothetical protein VJB65_02895, partial [Patescibacteria group bacterium]|nr:hypothetical protein [Patescibacteria group bacterium]